MRKLVLVSLLLGFAAAVVAQNITIARQGHFSVGGQTIQRPGAYDNSKFVGWTAQEEMALQRLCCAVVGAATSSTFHWPNV